MMLGDSMAFLCIASGRSSTDVVKLKEGEVWEIDQYTMRLEDSSVVRDKNAKLLAQFQKMYPHSGTGAVRLFKPSHKVEGSWSEWIVLYKKHYIAFQKILTNQMFMQYYARTSQRYFSPYDRKQISYYPRYLKTHMGRYCKELKRRDKEKTGKNGGPLYYGFIRETIYQYMQYCNSISPLSPSIDTLYEKHLQQEKEKHRVITPSNPTPVFVTPTDNEYEIDPDILKWDEIDRTEPRFSMLTSFLCNPEFDRQYGGIFKDSYLFLLGNPPQDMIEKEEYQRWYQYCEEGFDGTVVCPTLSKNTGWVREFEKASIVFFYVREASQTLEKTIALALANRSEVVILLYNPELYANYQKKYKEASIFLLNSFLSNDEVIDGVDEFMIAAYNRERDKKYTK